MHLNINNFRILSQIWQIIFYLAGIKYLYDIMYFVNLDVITCLTWTRVLISSVKIPLYYFNSYYFPIKMRKKSSVNLYCCSINLHSSLNFKGDNWPLMQKKCPVHYCCLVFLAIEFKWNCVAIGHSRVSKFTFVC